MRSFKQLRERCWTGYKPKPGKKPYEKGSCVKEESELEEDLRKWFDPKHPEGGWKRINSKGEAIGPCAREPGEAKPKCMSNEKRAALSKKERAAAVSAKRRHDPNPERKGEPINVSNFGKGKLSEQMDNLEEENKPTNPELWARAKSLAKSKFDVYPSAYANGWAAKWYKSKGGGWKSVSEETEVNENVHTAIKKIRKEDSNDDKSSIALKALVAKKNLKQSEGKYKSPEFLKKMKDRVKAGEKLKEETDEPPIHVRSLYTQTYAKHGGTLQAAKTASEKAYAAVEKKHGTEMRDKLQAFHARNMNEETDTTEKVEMVQSQLHFIKYACEEILDYIEMGGEVEEWYQVKVAKSFSEFESLHAFIEGESRRTGMKEEVDSEKGDYDVPVTYRHKVDGKTQEVNKTYRVKNAMSHRHASNIGMKLGRRDAEKAGHNAHWMTAGWKKVNEETEQLDEISANLVKKARDVAYSKGKEEQSFRFSRKHYEKEKKESDAFGRKMAEEKEQGASKKKEEKFHMKLDDLVHKTFGHSPKEKMAKEEKETAPFEGGKPKKGVVTDKSGAKHGTMSRVRDIARQALKKQSEKLKTVKESLDESRKAEIVKDAVKSAKDKKAESKEKFQSEPILSSEIMKETK